MLCLLVQAVYEVSEFDRDVRIIFVVQYSGVLIALRFGQWGGIRQ
jgi:hypothetical protein